MQGERGRGQTWTSTIFTILLTAAIMAHECVAGGQCNCCSLIMYYSVCVLMLWREFPLHTSSCYKSLHDLATAYGCLPRVEYVQECAYVCHWFRSAERTCSLHTHVLRQCGGASCDQSKLICHQEGYEPFGGLYDRCNINEVHTS